MTLTPKQQRFVGEYLIDLNATQAAIRAGYAKGSAAVEGARLLTNAKVRSAVDAAIQRRAERTGITAERVLQELAIIGFSDARHYKLGEFGGLNLGDGAPDHSMRAVSSVKHRTRTDDDGNTTYEVEFRLWDKNTALANIGKHLGMFTDKVDITSGGQPLVIRVVKE